MTDRKAVIKNADMSEDIRQTPSNALRKHSRNTTSKRTSPPSSKKNSTKNTAQPGTASLDATLEVTSPTRQNTLFTFIWDRSPSSSSNLDKVTSEPQLQTNH